MNSENSEIIIKNSLDYLPDLQCHDLSALEELDDLLLDAYAEHTEEAINKESRDIQTEQNVFEESPQQQQEFEILKRDNVTTRVLVEGIELNLRTEEAELLSSCLDPVLKQALLRNRMEMREIEENCRSAMVSIQKINQCAKAEIQYLVERRQSENKPNKKTSFKELTLNWKIGRPYFKDEKMFGAPKNDDFKLKRAQNEHYVNKCSEGPRWTFDQQKTLTDAVTQHYFKYRRTQLDVEMFNINLQIKDETDEAKLKDLQEKLTRLEQRNFALNLESPKLAPPLDCDRNIIDWEKISLIDLKGKRTASECKAMWHCYVHPDINKTKWTPEEDDRIKDLVVKHKCNWNLIAKELGTNRSSYLIFIHFNTDLYDRFKKGRFQPQEDKLLMNVVAKCRMDHYIPWSRVRNYFSDRAKYQLYHRYKYYLEPRNIKKGSFTEAEDVLLMYLVKSIGKDYTSIAQAIPNRTSVQVRNRYTTYLEKDSFSLGSFTVEEDRTILEHISKHGEFYRPLANKLNRCRAHIRQRYLTLRKLMAKDTTLKLEDIPRRRQTFLNGYQKERYKRMEKCLQELEGFDKIPTLKEIELKLRNIARRTKYNQWKVNRCVKTYTKHNSKADQELANFLQLTCKVEKEKLINFIDHEQVHNSAKRIMALLHSLGGNTSVFFSSLFHSDNDLSDQFGITKREKCAMEKIIEYCDYIDSEDGEKPRTSISSQSPLDNDGFDVDFVLPANINSLALFRGLLLYFHKLIYKNTLENPSEEVIEIVDNTTIIDEESRKTKRKFNERLKAVFKWPGTLSEYHPENELNEKPVIVVDKQQSAQPAKVGRPPKKVYHKVLKMIEAKKKKRDAGTNKETLTTENQNNSVTASTSNTNDEGFSPGKKRGRPRKHTSDGNESKLPHAKKRGRPSRKHKPLEDETNNDADDESIIEQEETFSENNNKKIDGEDLPMKRGPGRPKLHKSRFEHEVLYMPLRIHIKGSKGLSKTKKLPREVLLEALNRKIGDPSTSTANVSESSSSALTTSNVNIERIGEIENETIPQNQPLPNESTINPKQIETQTTKVDPKQVVRTTHSDKEQVDSNQEILKRSKIQTPRDSDKTMQIPQNQTNNPVTNKGPIILRVVDPKEDKVLQQLLKEKRLIPLNSKSTNNFKPVSNIIIRRPEKKLQTENQTPTSSEQSISNNRLKNAKGIKRKRSQADAEQVTQNEKPCLVNQQLSKIVQKEIKLLPLNPNNSKVLSDSTLQNPSSKEIPTNTNESSGLLNDSFQSSITRLFEDCQMSFDSDSSDELTSFNISDTDEYSEEETQTVSDSDTIDSTVEDAIEKSVPTQNNPGQKGVEPIQDTIDNDDDYTINSENDFDLTVESDEEVDEQNSNESNIKEESYEQDELITMEEEKKFDKVVEWKNKFLHNINNQLINNEDHNSDSRRLICKQEVNYKGRKEIIKQINEDWSDEEL